jgi:uncharacterized membrane protein YgdD (TMEM256/DUF423 family)
VGFGAYGAHALAHDPHAALLADRASTYGLWHGLALIAADRLAASGRRMAHLSALLFTAGLLLFSGSLALKALYGAIPFPMATPAGGVALIAGWLVLAATAFSSQQRGDL